jgi:glycosyltransferase involved in cell wall biosynthesis
MYEPTPALSIVIPAYNEARWVAACIRSLARQDIERTYEVILVDNNSTDATVAVARAAGRGLDVRVIRESRQGRGAARRAGFEAARGQIIFSADVDTVYPPDWCGSLLAAMAESGIVAATGTAQIDDLGRWRNAIFNLFQPLTMWCYWLILGHHCLSGFNVAIRRDVYTASGGFDVALNAEEDADLSRRVAQLGKIRFVHVPVTFSGRRFRRGLLRGLLDYVVLFARYRARRTSAALSDIR